VCSSDLRVWIGIAIGGIIVNVGIVWKGTIVAFNVSACTGFDVTWNLLVSRLRKSCKTN